MSSRSTQGSLEAGVIGLHRRAEGRGAGRRASSPSRRPARARKGSDAGWKTALSDYKIPRAFKFVDELPRNGTDKVRKSELAALFTLYAN